MEFVVDELVVLSQHVTGCTGVQVTILINTACSMRLMGSRAEGPRAGVAAPVLYEPSWHALYRECMFPAGSLAEDPLVFPGRGSLSWDSAYDAEGRSRPWTRHPFRTRYGQ